MSRRNLFSFNLVVVLINLVSFRYNLNLDFEIVIIFRTEHAQKYLLQLELSLSRLLFFGLKKDVRFILLKLVS